MHHTACGERRGSDLWGEQGGARDPGVGGADPLADVQLQVAAAVRREPAVVCAAAAAVGCGDAAAERALLGGGHAGDDERGGGEHGRFEPNAGVPAQRAAGAADRARTAARRPARDARRVRRHQSLAFQAPHRHSLAPGRARRLPPRPRDRRSPRRQRR
eukprot:1678539-Rhodomonas_salina.3